MTNRTQEFPGDQERLEEEAVVWVVRLASGEATNADRDEIRAWRGRSPAHDAAFHKASRLWLGMEGLRQELLSDGPSGPPDSKRSIAAKSSLGARIRPVPRRAWIKRSAVAATLAAIAVVLALQGGLLGRLTSDYYTGTGEQVVATLADGSRLDLNTQAAVAVRYSGAMRRVDLLQGEAAFRVEKDASRPFIVQAQGGRIRAIGTEFLVQSTPQAVLVTVAEGVVEVRAAPDHGSGAAAVLVKAGERVRYGHGGVGAIESADVQKATAWQRGKLIFESVPLSTVIEEINRYRPGRVVLLNDALARHPVSGVFDLQRLDSAVTTIVQTLPVTTVRLTERYVLLR